jgi:hypothetical protein
VYLWLSESNFLRKQKGMTTFLVLVMLGIMAVLVGAYYYLISGEKKGFYLEFLREKAYYIAQSGYNLTIAMLLDHGFDHRWYSGPNPGYKKDLGTGEIIGLQSDIKHTATFTQDYAGGKFTVFVQEEPLIDGTEASDMYLKCVHIFVKGIYRNMARIVYGRIVFAPPKGYFEPYWNP